MNRRNFIQLLGIAPIVAAVMPRVLADDLVKPPFTQTFKLPLVTTTTMEDLYRKHQGIECLINNDGVTLFHGIERPKY